MSADVKLCRQGFPEDSPRLGQDVSPHEFIERSDFRGALAVFGDYALIILIAFASISLAHPLAYVAAVWMIGLIMLGLGEALTHEASHYNLFRTRWLNDIGEIFYCLPFLFTIASYRNQHQDHHSSVSRSPEAVAAEYEAAGIMPNGRNMIWIWFIKPVIGCAGWLYLDSVATLLERRSVGKLLVFWALVFGAFTVSGNLDILILYWIVPLLWSFSSFFYWSEIEDHYNTVSGSRTNVSWTNAFTHNNGYHYIHHQYPTIPWYRLPESHAAFCADNPDISTGFLDTFRQISRQRPRDNPDAPEESGD